MDENKIACKLAARTALTTRLGKPRAGADEEMDEEQFQRITGGKVSGMVKFAREHGGKVRKWSLGDGWQEVISFNVTIRMSNGGRFYSDSSESCILYALKEMCKALGLDVKKITDEDMSGVEEWAGLCKLPSTWKPEHVGILADDLQDVNYHTEMSKLMEEAEAKLGSDAIKAALEASRKAGKQRKAAYSHPRMFWYSGKNIALLRREAGLQGKMPLNKFEAQVQKALGEADVHADKIAEAIRYRFLVRLEEQEVRVDAQDSTIEVYMRFSGPLVENPDKALPDALWGIVKDIQVSP